MIQYNKAGLMRRAVIGAVTLASLVGCGHKIAEPVDPNFNVLGHSRNHKVSSVDQLQAPNKKTIVILREQGFYVQKAKDLPDTLDALNIELYLKDKTTEIVNHTGRVIDLKTEHNYVPVNQVQRNYMTLPLISDGDFAVKAEILETDYTGTHVGIKKIDENNARYKLDTIVLEIDGKNREFYTPMIHPFGGNGRELGFYLVEKEHTKIHIKPNGNLVLESTKVYRPILKKEIIRNLGPQTGAVQLQIQTQTTTSSASPQTQVTTQQSIAQQQTQTTPPPIQVTPQPKGYIQKIWELLQQSTPTAPTTTSTTPN